MSLDEQIFVVVKKLRGGVSFVEIKREIPEFRGDKNFEVEPNLVVWSGVSAEGVDALVRLINSKKVCLVSGSYLSYLADGVILRLPIAKRWQPYKEPHWLPMFLWLPKEVAKRKKKPRVRTAHGVGECPDTPELT